MYFLCVHTARWLLSVLIADPVVPLKDSDDTHCDTETHNDRPCDTEGNRLHDTESGRLRDMDGDTNIMGITIHGTDCLVPDVRLIHPLIQLHVVDMDTGQYMKKSDKYTTVQHKILTGKI